MDNDLIVKLRANAIKTLEFGVILNMLADHAVSERAKNKSLALKPFLNESQCLQKMIDTTEARKILESIGAPPLSVMKEIDKIFDLAVKEALLFPEQLTSVASFINSCRRMKIYLKKAESLNVSLAGIGESFHLLDELYYEIDRSIRNDAVEDNASPALRDLRRKIENCKSSIKEKLESLLRNRKEYFADDYVVTRNGRFVLPVKKEYKNQIDGSVIDVSGKGGTYFIEPSSVRKLQDEITLLQIAEENEVRRILYALTALVDANITELKLNAECMETLDHAFAKAKLSVEMNAVPVTVTTERRIKIIGGRHPLLKQSTCVPLDFELGGDIRGVVITGPNTGGKTVALKTVGLLSLMAQSGLHIPADAGTVLCMNGGILCDVGDGQSITENLSTFSSHITNITDILKAVNDESLVLLDELGAGTDPAEGMGLAIAILTELKNKNCLFLTTTHYPEVKDFAKTADNLINARMEFDRESLKPLFKLKLGEAGESCALYIAERLGFPKKLLLIAEKTVYGSSEREYETEAADTVSAENRVKKADIKSSSPTRSEKFNIGDSVTVYPQKTIGIIYKKSDEKGELGVQIKDKKQFINHKRLKLLVPADKLYPDDYDFSIIFDSVAHRKAKHDMERKHDPNLVIKYESNEK